MAKLSRANQMQAKKRVRRQKALNKSQAKAVKSIVKKVTASQEETKYFTYGTSLVPSSTGTGLTSYNLFYHNASQGVTNNTLIGDKLNWRGLKVKWSVLNNTGSAWFDTPFTIVMAVIATKKYAAVTSLALDDIRDDTSSQTNRFFLNEQSKMLYKKEIRVSQAKTGDRKRITGNFWLKRNQMLKYKDFTTNHELKDMNYYLCFWAYDEHNLLTSGSIYFVYKNYFKDA